MRMRGHSFKPRVRFLGGKADYYVGVELELEAPDCRILHEGLALRRAGAVYAKADGSLRDDSGVELVTHPIARTAWTKKLRTKGPVAKFLGYVKQLQELGFTSHNNGRCGLHVHVSRSAIRDRVHMYFFGRLVNSRLFRQLSQRADTGFYYCRQHPFTVNNARFDSEAQESRYQALNLENDRTIEVRIFRGNTREERIRKAVEAVIAGIEFTRSLTSRDYSSDLCQRFRAFITTNASTYPNLCSFLFADMPQETRQCA